MRHASSRGGLVGAYSKGELMGVLGRMQPGRCRPSGLAALHFAGVVVTINPPGGVWRIARWLAAWSRWVAERARKSLRMLLSSHTSNLGRRAFITRAMKAAV